MKCSINALWRCLMKVTIYIYIYIHLTLLLAINTVMFLITVYWSQMQNYKLYLTLCNDIRIYYSTYLKLRYTIQGKAVVMLQ